MAEKLMQQAIAKSINLTVPWYLMLSYAYYVEDDPLVSDSSFDALAKLMLEHWGEITHPHKDLITTDDLKAGSLLRRDFPSVVAGAVADVRSRTNGKKAKASKRKKPRG